MDRLADWRMDGRINIQVDMFYNLQKEPGNFFQKPTKPFLRKKSHSPMEKGRIEFLVSFYQPG